MGQVSEISSHSDETQGKKWADGEYDMQTVGTDTYSMEGKEQGKTRKNTTRNSAKAETHSKPASKSGLQYQVNGNILLQPETFLSQPER